MTEDCVFCRIIAGKEPGIFVSRWPDAVAIEPLNPVVAGHTLVIPRGHVPDAGADPLITAAVVARAVELAEHRDYDGYNLITSVGSAATQTIWHLHWHIVPRRAGDGLTLPWTGQVKS